MVSGKLSQLYRFKFAILHGVSRSALLFECYRLRHLSARFFQVKVKWLCFVFGLEAGQLVLYGILSYLAEGKGVG